MGSVASRAERQATDRLLLGDHAPGNWRHWALGSSPQLEWGLCSGKYSGFRRNEIPPHSLDIQILAENLYTLDAELRQYYWTPSILFMCSLILLLQDYISSRIGRWVSTLDTYLILSSVHSNEGSRWHAATLHTTLIRSQHEIWVLLPPLTTHHPLTAHGSISSCRHDLILCFPPGHEYVVKLFH